MTGLFTVEKKNYAQLEKEVVTFVLATCVEDSC